ncbi:MAG TPA: N-acetylmuramoyl-L-alanine amidase [Vicinamibacterales bacterium]|nr:N-acetylmuramoyl-L-alanine amidase [Vicinamibacterales bacterium]
MLPRAVRLIIELDAEVPYRQERLANPDRVFIDLQGVRSASDLELPQDFDGSLVRQVRIGQHPDDTLRIVFDVDGAATHSVFALYSPYRLVVDLHAPSAEDVRRVANPQPPDKVRPAVVNNPPPPVVAAVLDTGDAEPSLGSAMGTSVSVTPPPPSPSPAAAPLPKRETPTTVPAGPPAANLKGRFSLSRQLGLGVSRIVIDPGHGGKDPGARSKGLTEAEIVLDVALRLEKILKEREGFEVVLTRRTDEYIPLEERTAIANREDADLFLSIHANASRNKQANGIETYFLNFATSPDAEAVAARENAASGQTMHRLPDIVKAITLNNKLAESRDFATFVQRAMVEGVRGANKQVRDLGVKQAPFVVLIGAAMPSILAEISFVTHAKEGRLLASPVYRQRIAEALAAGVVRYQHSLKSVKVAQSD